MIVCIYTAVSGMGRVSKKHEAARRWWGETGEGCQAPDPKVKWWKNQVAHWQLRCISNSGKLPHWLCTQWCFLFSLEMLLWQHFFCFSYIQHIKTSLTKGTEEVLTLMRCILHSVGRVNDQVTESHKSFDPVKSQVICRWLQTSLQIRFKLCERCFYWLHITMSNLRGQYFFHCFIQRDVTIHIAVCI